MNWSRTWGDAAARARWSNSCEAFMVARSRSAALVAAGGVMLVATSDAQPESMIVDSSTQAVTVVVFIMCCSTHQPPTADIGRAGCVNVGEEIWWPDNFVQVTSIKNRSMSASLAPFRRSGRRPHSVVLKRHGRTKPSAVSRKRLHAPQNGLLTGAMKPTVPSAPSANR